LVRWKAAQVHQSAATLLTPPQVADDAGKPATRRTTQQEEPAGVVLPQTVVRNEDLVAINQADPRRHLLLVV
jgi:hypothetical protein